MADGYKVGNLEIAFKAVDETSASFKELAKNLRAINNLVTKLGNADLSPFVANIKNVGKALSPMLKNIKSASEGIIALNQSIQALGVNKLSKLAKEIGNINKETEDIENNSGEITEGIENSNKAIQEAKQEVIDFNSIWQKLTQSGLTKLGIYNQMQQTKIEIEKAEQALAGLQRKFVEGKGGAAYGWAFGYTEQAEQLVAEMKTAEEEVDRLKKKLGEQQAQFGSPFNEAQQRVSQLKNELLNTTLVTGEINEKLVSQIKNLQSQIDITGNKVKNALAEPLSPLKEAQQRLAQLKQQFAEIAFAGGNTNNVANQMQELKAQLDRVDYATQRVGMSQAELIASDYNTAKAELQKKIAILQSALASGKAGEQTKKYKKELQELLKELEKLTKSEKKNNKEKDKGTKSWKKLFNSIKRIAVYRLIRGALKQITQSLSETAQAFAMVDDSVNQTMSEVTSSLSVIKLSFGSLLLPFIQMVSPILQQIAVVVANVANTINQAMSTTGKYTKINAEYMKNYRDELDKTSGSLLDFDKFRALDQGNKGGLSDFLLPDQDVEETNENVLKIKSILEKLRNIISNVFGIIEKVGKPVLNTIGALLEPIISLIDSVISGLYKFITWLDEAGALEPILYGLIAGLTAFGGYKVISSISALTGSLSKLQLVLIAVGAVATLVLAVIGAWGQMNDFQRAAALVGILTVAVFGLALALGAFHSAWSIGIAAVAIVGGIAAIVASITAAKNSAATPVDYATGGVPDKGTIFRAGEAGAEIVYNTPSGQSGVVNVQQIASAVRQGAYQALIEWSSKGGGDNTLVVNLDGEQVYKNVTAHAKRRGQKWA